jgi:hypothetical protein
MTKKLYIKDNSSSRRDRFTLQIDDNGTFSEAGIATKAETIAGAITSGFVVPSMLKSAIKKIFPIAFTGTTAAEGITATGTAVSDIVLGVCGLSTAAYGVAATSFESTITTANKIAQISTANLSAVNYVAILYRPS